MILIMKAIYTILLIVCSSFNTLAAEDITGRSLKFAPYNDIDRLEALERENQHLLGRIEIAEHNIAKLEASLNLLQQGSAVLPSVGGKNLKEELLTDIFELTTEPSVIRENKKSKSSTNNSQNNIAKDKELYDLALASFKENKLVEAEKKFAEFLKNFPSSPLVSNAYFWYGETFAKRNIFDKAAVNYLKGYKQDPKGAKASDSLLKLALSLGSLNKHQQACAILNKLEVEFPSRAMTSVTRTKEAQTKFGCKN